MLVAAMLLAGWFGAAALRAADDEEWRVKALALNDITGEGPIAGEIKKLASDPAQAKKLLAVATPLSQEKKQPFTYNAAYILANVAVHVKDYQAGQKFYQICAEEGSRLRSVQKLIQAYSGLMEIIDALYGEKNYAQSAKLSQEFLETLEREGVQEGLKNDVLRRMIRALAKQGKVDEAQRMTDNLLKARANDWHNVELKGWLEQETGRTAEAARTYEELFDLIPKDKSLDKEKKAELVADVHYMLSGVYVDLNRIDKAADHLKVLLKQNPSEAKYNNDLGYIWADHDMNLDEAEQMIKKALEEDRKQRRKGNPDLSPEEDKDNAAYLDSMGWVLFKKKKYEEAKPFLLKAIEDKEGQHVEIYDHLGDLYLKLGQKAEAVAAWKKGIDAAGTSKREQERKAQVEAKVKNAESR
jgi:tetratricopeptide (TPR) repeat protein